MSVRLMVSPDSFLGSLTFQELQYLRRHVRESLMVGWPDHAKTDRECDRLIEVHGPSVRERVLKKAIDARWGR